MIRKKKVSRSIVLDIDGSEGNAFNLIGTATMLGRDCGYSEKEIKEMVDDMKSGEYINLLKILDKNFGSVVVMETNNKEYLEALS